MTPADFAAIALPAVNTVGIFLLLRGQRRTGNGAGHGPGSLTDRVTIQLGEMELRLGEKFSSLEYRVQQEQEQLNRRVDNLHERIDGLEERQKGSAT